MFRFAWLGSLLIGSTLLADVKLPAIFGDNMVLQRDKTVAVWGSADAGEQITVTAGGVSATATADDKGKWKVDLAALKASDQPIELTVAGKNTLTFKNVLVGDVWIASGQSNMEWPLSNTFGSREAMAEANHPNLRLFLVRKRTWIRPLQLEAGEGKWVLCTPETVRGFSAVAYYFARDIQQTQKVPVGVIGTYWGGTPAQAWTSIEGLRAAPELAGFVETYDRNTKDIDGTVAKYEKDLQAWNTAKKQWDQDHGPAFKEAMAKWAESAKQAKAAGQPEPARPTPAQPEPKRPELPWNPHHPTTLYNAMIAPLVPMSIKGFIWYQGESNAGNPVLYRTLFPAMITDWRKQFAQGDVPFLFVSLANFMDRRDEPTQTSGGWPGLREAQSMTLKLPNTGQAIAIDVGEARDIHPRDKKTVGQRLAIAARGVAYGEKITIAGPTFESMKVDGEKVRVTFQNAEGLTLANPPTTQPADARPAPTQVKGFAIAGADRQFHWASAAIEGNAVVLSSDKVKEPLAVRYAWADNPEVNLYNKEGLPAVPFRTDDWADAAK